MYARVCVCASARMHANVRPLVRMTTIRIEHLGNIHTFTHTSTHRLPLLLGVKHTIILSLEPHENLQQFVKFRIYMYRSVVMLCLCWICVWCETASGTLEMGGNPYGTAEDDGAEQANKDQHLWECKH